MSAGGAPTPNPSLWRSRDFMLLWAAQAIGQTAQNAYNYILGFLGGILALMLGYGGYLWMFNHDDAQRINRGKHLVIAAAVGGMFVFLGNALSTDLRTKVFQ